MPGYKLTTLFDSMYNLVIITEVLTCLGIDIYDICAQGDDTYLIIKENGVKYDDIIEGYLNYGVQISVKKNIMSKQKSFFIRNIIREEGMRGAALRPLNSVYFKSEGKRDEGIDTLTTAGQIVASRLLIWKELDLDKMEAMFKYMVQNSTFKNVRVSDISMIRNPQNYKIRWKTPRVLVEQKSKIKEWMMKQADESLLLKQIHTFGVDISLKEHIDYFVEPKRRSHSSREWQEADTPLRK